MWCFRVNDPRLKNSPNLGTINQCFQPRDLVTSLGESNWDANPPLATRKIIKLNGEFWSHVWLLGNPQGDADLSVFQKVSYRWPFPYSFPVFYDLGWLQGPPHSLTPCSAGFFAGDLGHSRFNLVGLSAEKMENPVATGPKVPRISARLGYERRWENDIRPCWGLNGDSMGKPSIFFFQVHGNIAGYYIPRLS